MQGILLGPFVINSFTVFYDIRPNIFQISCFDKINEFEAENTNSSITETLIKNHNTDVNKKSKRPTTS